MDFHRDPEAMAKCLISYIADDRRVQSEVKAIFMSSIPLRTIRLIRAAKMASADKFKRGLVAKNMNEIGWDWRGEKYATQMDLTSILFVNAIAEERKASAQVAEHRARRERGFEAARLAA